MAVSGTEHRTSADAVSSDRLSREILVLAVVVILGTIMTVLDLTIVNVVIPTLGADLNASIPAIQWVLTGYMLAFATVIPLTGRATERYAAKRVWLTALLLFLAGSVLAGGAWSIGSFAALSQHARVHTAAALAGVFGTTLWVAVALIAAALVPTLLLPRPPRGSHLEGLES